jgi:TRAP-type C4-dicarboxylate transport system permease small subunit
MAVVIIVLALDTVLCCAYLGYQWWAESARMAMDALPDTRWQHWWKYWFLVTFVGWIGAILLRAALADARKNSVKKPPGRV